MSKWVIWYERLSASSAEKEFFIEQIKEDFGIDCLDAEIVPSRGKFSHVRELKKKYGVQVAILDTEYLLVYKERRGAILRVSPTVEPF